MAYIEDEGRNQGTLFPVVLDDLVSADHMCRVIDAFVEQFDMEMLGSDERNLQILAGLATILTHCSSSTCTVIRIKSARQDDRSQSAEGT